MDKDSAHGSTTYRFIVLTLMGCGLGTVVSLSALLFVECVSWLNTALLVAPRARVQILDDRLLAFLTVLVPTLGGALVGSLIYRLSAERRVLGPADVIFSAQLRKPMPDARSGLVSTIASVLSLGCGASVGQYGPLVYLGALQASLLDRLKLRIPNARSIAIACGVAAAISTAFNAPIAGLVFAHEVILRHYSLQAFAPTTVASASGFIVANVLFERPPLFLVTFAGVGQVYEFALFALLGIACACLAVVFMKCVLGSARIANASRLHPALRPAVAGLVVGMVALELPDVLGIGTELLRFATIEGAFDNLELASLVIAKLLLTALCLGFGFAGGIFSPSLLVGILFGALCWNMLGVVGVENSGIAVYAISSMMALASAIIGAPLTAILIVFELTRNYELTIAAMVSVVFANLVVFRWAGRSLFDIQLAARGVNLSAGRDRAQMQQLYLSSLPLSKAVMVDPGDAATTAYRRMLDARRAEAVVVKASGQFVGLLRLQDLAGDAKGTVSEKLQTDSLVLYNDSSLWDAMNGMQGFIGETIPVLSRDGQRFLGVLSEGDIISAYMQTVHRARREENDAL
ncbi:chloride channel protein [Granulosicoccus sp. 3-233]|uniref:chloride channel protein n=1 Tax=Granulosicoccus sp. 3-233 TaxID=3417969 RepID=UPI003D33D14E